MDSADVDYSYLREWSSIKENDLLEFDSEDIFRAVVFLTFFLTFYLSLPVLVTNAAELTKKGSKIYLENEDFFFYGQRKIQKLYKEYDFRPTKKSRSFRNSNKIGQKIIDTTAVSTKILSTSKTNIEVILNLPPIDIVKLFYQIFNSFFAKETVVTTTELVANNTGLVAGIQDKKLLIRGGFFGYAAAKIGKKVTSKVLGTAGKKVSNWLDSDNDSSDGKSTKQQNQLRSSILQFFKDNPTGALLLAGYAIINRKQNGNIVKDTIYNTLPSNVANILVGKKHSLKTIFRVIISPRKPYLYVTVVVLILILYRVQFSRLFRREITPNEVISEITKSFLKTNKKDVKDSDSKSFFERFFPLQFQARENEWKDMMKDSSYGNLLKLSLENDMN